MTSFPSRFNLSEVDLLHTTYTRSLYPNAFYHENLDGLRRCTFEIRMDSVYPTVPCVLGDLEFQCPRDTLEFLTLSYSDLGHGLKNRAHILLIIDHEPTALLVLVFLAAIVFVHVCRLYRGKSTDRKFK